MKTADFYYELPEELIAQDPLSDRAASRLLVIDKITEKRTHTDFHHYLMMFITGRRQQKR